MPVISLGMLLLLWAIPKIDPLKKNFEVFCAQYNKFVLLMIFFLFYIYIASIFWNLGFHYDMTNVIVPAIAFVFVYLGNFMRSAKRNWFFGIKTPWTLSNDVVWEKTHKLGARMFEVAGVTMLFSIILPPSIMVYIIICAVAIVVIIPVVYSYFIPLSRLSCL